VPVEDGLRFLGRVAFAALGLGEALVERGFDGVAVTEEPVFFSCGIEVGRHGGSVAREFVRGRRKAIW